MMRLLRAEAVHYLVVLEHQVEGLVRVVVVAGIIDAGRRRRLSADPLR
jgi:hypothetical protein